MSDWKTPQGPKVWTVASPGWRRLSTEPPMMTMVSGYNVISYGELVKRGVFIFT